MWRGDTRGGDSRDREDRVHTLTEGGRGCIWIGAIYHYTAEIWGEKGVCVCVSVIVHTNACI